MVSYGNVVSLNDFALFVVPARKISQPSSISVLRIFIVHLTPHPYVEALFYHF
jgi:hypothetical protein